MALSAAQIDRAMGSVLASACGDALGSQYEFQPVLGPDDIPTFGYGTFGHAPGEWTDDTAMAVPVLLRLSEGGSFEDPASFAYVIDHWLDWSRTAKDIGIQTASVLSRLGSEPNEDEAREVSQRLHERLGRSAGNGALMRTGPLALGYLGEGKESALAVAATRLAQLTHWEDDNAAACTLWCLAIRHAILSGEIDVMGQVQHIPAHMRSRWVDLLDEAQTPGATPTTFAATNGWVVAALQASLSAINSTDSLIGALELAIRGGNDTDTVAAITGALAGARYGASQIPDEWITTVRGWPSKTASDLARLVSRVAGAPV